MVPTASDAVRDALAWLYDRLQETEWGDMGIIFSIHQGKIAKVQKVDCETIDCVRDSDNSGSKYIGKRTQFPAKLFKN